MPVEPRVSEQTLGIALSGTYFFSPASSSYHDKFETAKLETLDQCMTDVTKRGELHYTYWSPCINKRKGVASTLWTPNLCFDSPNCLRDTDEFVK